MTIAEHDVLRLNIAQWQGGDGPGYHIGGRIMAALLPDPTGPVETVPVPAPVAGERTRSRGIVSRDALLEMLAAAQAAIARHEPAAIVTAGGDCLVDLAPMAYLASRYANDLAVLWIDAHADVLNADLFGNANAHVLAMLLGEGDADFVAAVPRPLAGRDVCYVGLAETMPFEDAFIARHGLTRIGPEAVADSNQPVLDWLRTSGKTRVAIHFDLDVLDPGNYDFLLFGNPDLSPGALDFVARGRMRMERVLAILAAVGREAEVVGLAITEYLPWSAIRLADQLAALPLVTTERAGR